MRLTPRQYKRINNIIQEQVHSVLSTRRSLTERGPNAMNVDMTIMDQVVQEKMYDLSIEAASECVNTFRKKLFKQIADEMNKHAMSHTKITASELERDMDEEDLGEEELAMSIATALHRYAGKLSSEATVLAGGAEVDNRDYKQVLPGRGY